VLDVEYAPTPIAVAAVADIISVHLSLSSETRGLLGEAFFQQLKPGAVFINTSRGEVVDEAALTAALTAGRISAGLDVFNQEPTASEAKFSSDITHLPNLYGTHHIGASTDQAEYETGEEVVRIVTHFLNGSEIPNCVNLRRSPTSGYGLVVRHEDHVGVLAAVFGVLKEHGCNVQEMQNQIFKGALAACANIMLDGPVSNEVVEHIKQCEGVLHVATVG
jgi:D-3-phosphoglycerate dehydrogenase